MKELIEQMKMLYEEMGKKEFAESIAAMLWNIYNECISKGFNPDQAMAITLGFSKSMSSK